MTREEARAELDACTLRPGDASEEARAFAAQDAELAQWLAERTRFDQAVAEAMRPAPAAPREMDGLLAAMQAQARASSSPMPARTPLRAFSLQSRAWMAAAAALALAAIGWWFQSGTESDAAPWQAEALGLIAQVDSGKLRVDHAGGSLAGLKSLLAETHAPVPCDELPAGITGMRSLACKVVKVAGRPASIVCFLIAPHKEAHLIVMKKEGLQPVPEGRPQFGIRDGWHTAAWSFNGQNYLLATQADEALLRKLFAGLVQQPRRLLAMVLVPP